MIDLDALQGLLDAATPEADASCVCTEEIPNVFCALHHKPEHTFRRALRKDAKELLRLARETQRIEQSTLEFQKAWEAAKTYEERKAAWDL